MSKRKGKYKFNAAQLKWLRALESGDYAQSKGALCDGKGFCCLGVACDVLGAAVEEPAFSWQSYAFGAEKEHSVLPEAVRKKLKLRTSSGEIHSDRSHRIGSVRNCEELTEANDSGAKFKSIARFIRSHPETLFTDA